MNKRQRKKRNKEIKKRMDFFKYHLFYYGRMNGKTFMIDEINKVIFNKKYRPFKELEKKYKGLILAVDWSNGIDYSIKTRARIIGKAIKILSTEIISEN